MRVIFFGTSAYCLPVLETLKANFNLVAVVTRPDKPVGRKQIMTPSATRLWAKQYSVQTLTDIKDIQDIQDIDLGIVADFGQIIPENALNLPRLGTFNIHFSKLPEFRGASPVQATLLRGDKTAWVTIFKLEKTLDTGPILWQKEYPILKDDTAGKLYTRLFEEVAKELPTIINSMKQTKLLPQDKSKATYTKLLTKQDGFVDWDQLRSTAYGLQTYNQFRAVTPWPGLWTVTPEGKRMKILQCHLEGNKLVLDEIQYEGKKPQKAQSCLSPIIL
ncbi:hypothetical protein M1403_03760 [Patescibacteria group bacterium]|nr:hypothetical protein [Patescibacteria group bacterium]